MSQKSTGLYHELINAVKDGKVVVMDGGIRQPFIVKDIRITADNVILLYTTKLFRHQFDTKSMMFGKEK